jgi:hypothetical protein
MNTENRFLARDSARFLTVALLRTNDEIKSARCTGLFRATSRGSLSPTGEELTMKTVLLALLAISTAPTYLQTADIQALMSISQLRCDFPLVAQADWKSDRPAPIVKKQDFGFDITGIDLAGNSARIAGQLGSTALVVSKGIDVINFLERSPLGVLNVTSVFAARDKVGRFKAVHSRHLSGGGVLDPFPSQSYGFCNGARAPRSGR